ncbi:MAG TPA: beta-propeller domain-containing protein, partial [Rubricoccaceae bacterium]
MVCRLRVLILAGAVGTAASASAQDEPRAPVAGAPLVAFETDAALAAFGQDLAGWQQRLDAEQRRLAEQRMARCQTTTQATVGVFPNAVQPTAFRSAVISGQVVEADGVTSVIGATLRIGETNLAAATDIDGRFRRFVDSTTVAVAGSHRLVASYAGYPPAFADIVIEPGDSVSVSFTLCDGGELGEVNVMYAAPMADAVSSGDAESITNVQHAGVDEGGIVKRHGDHLVILRRGRLFTVDVSGRDLRPVDAVDAFGPGIDPEGAWYDEMLVVRETVVVIGYSYARQGTEIGLFEIDDRGRLRHHNTYHLRSNDYYSSRNYTARLVGGRLVFYTPLAAPARAWAGGPAGVLPALSRWTGDRDTPFVPIATATRVYRPARALTDPDDIALHTVTSCTVDRGALDCEATAVFGPFNH